MFFWSLGYAYMVILCDMVMGYWDIGRIWSYYGKMRN